MFMSRIHVGCFLLILLSVSAFHHGIVGARNLKDIYVEDYKEKTQNGEEGGSKIHDNNGYVANGDRKIPSGPDPKHNSGSDGDVPSYYLYNTKVEESATLPSKGKAEDDNWP